MPTAVIDNFSSNYRALRTHRHHFSSEKKADIHLKSQARYAKEAPHFGLGASLPTELHHALVLLLVGRGREGALPAGPRGSRRPARARAAARAAAAVPRHAQHHAVRQPQLLLCDLAGAERLPFPQTHTPKSIVAVEPVSL